MSPSRMALLAAALAAGAAGCRCGRGAEEAEAKAAVMRYLEKLVQAYRASDEEIVDPLVLPQHGEKLTGLIGVKRDQGVVLDAELLEIAFERLGEKDGRLLVETRERWRYRNLELGTGKVASPESTDEYRIRYELVREKGVLKLATLSFIGEPKVGTPIDPGPLDARQAHGLGAPEPPAGAVDPPAEPGRPPPSIAAPPPREAPQGGEATPEPR